MTRKPTVHYEVSLKQELAQRVVDQGHKQHELGKEYGIDSRLISRWAKEYRAGVHWARRPEQVVEDAELRRLRKENKRLSQEVEILKKASAYFAKNLA